MSYNKLTVRFRFEVESLQQMDSTTRWRTKERVPIDNIQWSCMVKVLVSLDILPELSFRKLFPEAQFKKNFNTFTVQYMYFVQDHWMLATGTFSI